MRFVLQVLAVAWGVWMASLSVVRAETLHSERPVVWLGVNSFQRLEQRLTETAQLMKLSGMAPLVLGILNLQWGGFQGLDRQRPIAMVVPTLVPVEKPPLVLMLPYSQQPALRSTLQRLFPQSTAQPDRLTLRGRFGQRAARFDPSAKVLLIAPTPALLHGVKIDLAADVFAASDGEETGPDVVLRVDAAVAKAHYPAEWNAWLAAMMQGMRQARDQVRVESQTAAAAELATFAYDVLERRQYQMLQDLDQMEIRITLAPDGWVARMEMRWQPQSITAAWANLQRHGTAIMPLCSEPCNRMSISLRQPDAWQRDMQTLLSLAQRLVENRLAAERPFSSEPRTDYRAGIHAGFEVIAHMLTGPSVEMGAEIRSGQTRVGPALQAGLTGWSELQQSGKHLQRLLNKVSSVSTTDAAPVGLSRNVAQHRGTSLHRIGPVAGESPRGLFLAAEDALLAWHVGSSPLGLLPILDRRPDRSPTPDGSRSNLLYLEGPLSFWLDLLQYTQPAASRSELDATATWLQGVTAPMRLEVTTQPSAATLRWVLPRTLLQGVAGVIKQHIVQTLQQSLLGR